MTAKTTTPELAQTELADAIAAAKSAIAAVAAAAAVPGAVTKTNAEGFSGGITELSASLTATRAMHGKLLRVVASTASRTKKAARVAKALELLAAQEALEAGADKK